MSNHVVCICKLMNLVPGGLKWLVPGYDTIVILALSTFLLLLLTVTGIMREVYVTQP